MHLLLHGTFKISTIHKYFFRILVQKENIDGSQLIQIKKRDSARSTPTKL